MITGFNTDVEYGGQVFHVQTEDKGQGNPVVVSLVYCGGEILETRRTPYTDMLAGEEVREDIVVELMQGQHQTLVREIRNGLFDPEGPKPFGYDIITNRSLDEVIVDFLRAGVEADPIRLAIESPEVFCEGDEVDFVACVRTSGEDDRPLADYLVVIELVTTHDGRTELASGITDQEGRLAACLELPELNGETGAIVVQVEGESIGVEVKRLIQPGERAA